MKSILIGKALFCLEAILTLVSLGVAAPTPSQTTDVDFNRTGAFMPWMEQYEKDHPGSKVGPYVGSMSAIPETGRIDIDGNFDLSGVPIKYQHRIELDCNGGCRNKFAQRRMVDTRELKKAPTCVLETLAAVAHYRFFCERTKRMDNVACWTQKEPTIDICCGEWVESPAPKTGPNLTVPVMKKRQETIHDLKYWVFSPITEKRKNKQGKKVMMERVIGTHWEHLKADLPGCPNFKPRDKFEYKYFTNHLQSWALFDADWTGKVNGLDYNWYEPIGSLRDAGHWPQVGDKDYKNATNGEK